LSDGRTVLAVGGGSGGVPQASADLFDAATLSWRATSPMKTARVAHAALLLKHGEVMVTGGITSGGTPVLSSAEIYAPASGGWSSAAPMHSARFDHSMVLLPDGRVLVAGGSNDGVNAYSSALSSVEIYDPVIDTWTDAPSLQTPRLLHKAAVLSDGVYVTAGANGTAMPAPGPRPGVIETTQVLSSTERLVFVVTAASDAGAPSQDGSGNSDVVTTADAAGQAASSGGCSCRVASARETGQWEPTTALLLAIAFVRRRRAKCERARSIGAPRGHDQ